MTPKLIAITGPLKGTTFALTKRTLSIGRESSNDLTIADPSVSRHHCLIAREATGYEIKDLESLNGTFINHKAIAYYILQHGDRITVGNSTFLFILDESEMSPPSRSVRLKDEPRTEKPTAPLRMDDTRCESSESLSAQSTSMIRLARDFDVLVNVGILINSMRKIDELGHRLLELILEVIPAERGAVLLADEGWEEGTSAYAWDRRLGSDRPIRVSRAIARRALQENIGILTNDIGEKTQSPSASSTTARSIRSLLCVPLVALGKVRGALYLDTTDGAVQFDEHHFQLATAIASMAAMAMEHMRVGAHLENGVQPYPRDPLITHSMIGESDGMRQVYQFITKVAPTDSTVLICGETGTGKELVARALHRNSPRADRPLVAINCATLSDTLLESELFGHEKGAFTGAIARKKGKLEVAHGGTVLLDEIGEMAPALQAKLLRILEERAFERVGGTRPIEADVRFIASTNKDLESAVAQGVFREDLYYRLNVVGLRMPSLRECRDDIPLLVDYFIAHYNKVFNRQIEGIAPEARDWLMRYHWPGNVRELRNVIERAFVLGSSRVIRPDDLPETVLARASLLEAMPTNYHHAIQELKKDLIVHAVERANGNYTEAAQLLGVHPNYLHRLIRNLNLKSILKHRPNPSMRR